MGNPEGDWRVQICERAMHAGWHVTITGVSKPLEWTREFFGVEAQNDANDFAFIRKTIAALFPTD